MSPEMTFTCGTKFQNSAEYGDWRLHRKSNISQTILASPPYKLYLKQIELSLRGATRNDSSS